MKKLFTTFLMMGVALCGWANVTAECPPGSKTVTVNYTADPNNSNELQNLNLDDLIKPHMRNGETLKITGDWANKDLATIGKIVGKFNNNVYLDLSACENMVSMINYTGTGDPDWTSNNFTYSYSNAPAEEINVTKKNYYYFDEDCTKPLESWAQSQVQSRDGNYYWTGWDGTSNGEHQVYPKTIWGYYNNQNTHRITGYNNTLLICGTQSIFCFFIRDKHTFCRFKIYTVRKSKGKITLMSINRNF